MRAFHPSIRISYKDIEDERLIRCLLRPELETDRARPPAPEGDHMASGGAEPAERALDAMKRSGIKPLQAWIMAWLAQSHLIDGDLAQARQAALNCLSAG